MPKDLPLAEVIERLMRGEVMAFPTETVYGFGCDPRNRKAVKKIFAIKGRDPSKPLLLVAADMKQVATLIDLKAVHPTIKRLMKKHWPGPLTLILPAKKHAKLSPEIIPNGEVAIRISSSPTARKLCRAFKFPLVATSANKSGEPECRSGRAVQRVFSHQKSQPDFLIDDGAIPKRKSSTVARAHLDGSVEVLRAGAVKISDCE